MLNRKTLTPASMIGGLPSGQVAHANTTHLVCYSTNSESTTAYDVTLNEDRGEVVYSNSVHSSYRWLIGAFIALFFSMQSYGFSHASNYGDAPHKHDGIDCAVTVLADDQLVVMPTVKAAEVVIIITLVSDYPDFQSLGYLLPQGRAPPPRGPPNSL